MRNRTVKAGCPPLGPADVAVVHLRLGDVVGFKEIEAWDAAAAAGVSAAPSSLLPAAQLCRMACRRLAGCSCF